MYVTRPLSHYKKFPESLSDNPDGPNSGCLVIQDEESETYCCFGLCRNRIVKDLPFPQNKNFSVQCLESSTTHVTEDGLIQTTHVRTDDVVLIPVLNSPLSANRYYVIHPHGKHKGEAITCSREEDMTSSCFRNCVEDIKARPLDLKNIYQQVEIFNYETNHGKGYYFYAKSVADDGFPPYFLRRKGWSIYTETPRNYELEEALGTNTALRARLPAFDNFPLSYKSSQALVVGKWYIPFMFIKDGTLKNQFKKSMYYLVTLEQRWEQIHKCKNQNNESVITVDVKLDIENVFVNGQKAMWDEKNVVDGMIFFNVDGNNGGGEKPSVGLKEEVVQRMKWEQKRGGGLVVLGMDQQREVNVRKEEKFEGNSWNEFGCYVLVESFVVKRMDGSIVLTYEFVHTHQLRSKWE